MAVRQQSTGLIARITDAVLTTWLNRLAARNGWLSIGRKRPKPHESWFAVAGYFYYYGHYYAGLCVEMLPAAARPPLQDQLAAPFPNAVDPAPRSNPAPLDGHL